MCKSSEATLYGITPSLKSVNLETHRPSAPEPNMADSMTKLRNAGIKMNIAVKMGLKTKRKFYNEPKPQLLGPGKYSLILFE